MLTGVKESRGMIATPNAIKNGACKSSHRSLYLKSLLDYEADGGDSVFRQLSKFQVSYTRKSLQPPFAQFNLEQLQTADFKASKLDLSFFVFYFLSFVVRMMYS